MCYFNQKIRGKLVEGNSSLEENNEVGEGGSPKSGSAI